MPIRFHADLAAIPRKPDVAIVGSGVAGLAAAFFLARAGLRPLLIERLPAPASLTSRRSGEGVRAQWELPHNIEIARNSIAILRDFETYTGRTAGYRPNGYLYASRTADGSAALAARVARQREAGLDDLEVYEGDAIARRFPTIAADARYAVFRAGDGVVSVTDVIAGYLAATEGDMLLDTQCHGVSETADGVVLETSRGRVAAGSAVLASGARLPADLAAIGFDAGLKVARSTLQFVVVDGVPPDHPGVIDTDLGSFWRPNADGARMTASFKSTLFLDAFTDDPQPDADYLRHALATVTSLVPFWRGLAPKIRDSHLRNGSFAVSADGAPLIGRVPGYRHLYVDGGYAGHGIMASPDGGRRLAEIVASGAAKADDPFSPSRFLDGKRPKQEPMTLNVNDARRSQG